MAGGADFDAHIALVRGARLEGMTAGADHTDFVVCGVNTGLHDYGGPFENLSISDAQKVECAARYTARGGALAISSRAGRAAGAPSRVRRGTSRRLVSAPGAAWR